MTEIGVVMEPVPKCSAEMAVRIENMGFDSILCPDTQNLSADPYGQLTLMAHHTKKIQLGTEDTFSHKGYFGHCLVTASLQRT